MVMCMIGLVSTASLIDDLFYLCMHWYCMFRHKTCIPCPRVAACTLRYDWPSLAGLLTVPCDYQMSSTNATKVVSWKFEALQEVPQGILPQQLVTTRGSASQNK